MDKWLLVQPSLWNCCILIIENIFNFIYHHYPEIQHRFSLLNNRYNVGCTQFDRRYKSAELPLCVGAFKPNDISNYSKFYDQNLIDVELHDIFKEHELLS